MTRHNPHVPRPREAALPNGDLTVVGDRQLSNDAEEVPADSRDLYELLTEILHDCHIPDTMPAVLARRCDGLLDVLDLVQDGDRLARYGLSYRNEVFQAVSEYREREPVRLAGVGCSGSKHEDEGLMPATNRYKGAYWSNKSGYGKNVADEWQVISAEHGLLHPETPIEYYERTPDDLRGVPVQSEQRLPNGNPVETKLDQWALDVHNALAEWLDDVARGVDPRDVELEILLGQQYREPLESRDVFDALRLPGELTVSFPFQEEPDAQGGMFEQISWMGDDVDAATEIVTDGGERTDAE